MLSSADQICIIYFSSFFVNKAETIKMIESQTSINLTSLLENYAESHCRRNLSCGFRYDGIPCSRQDAHKMIRTYVTTNIMRAASDNIL